MKASSVGIEVWVKINQKELSKLKNNSLVGEMTFRVVGDDSNNKRIIPIEIYHDPKQKELLSVEYKSR